MSGCSNDKASTSARFTASNTAPAPGLVKIVGKAQSGSRLVLDVLCYGPEAGLDLTGFKFGIHIGNANLVRFVSQSSYVETALLADAGQTIAIDVDGTSDPALVAIDVEKQGGGTGNGIAGSSAVVIELAFDVLGAGSTTLTFVGLDGNPPQALSSTRTTIPAVSFDGSAAGVMGVTTGGGGY